MVVSIELRMAKNFLCLLALSLSLAPVAQAHDSSAPHHVHPANLPTNQVSIRLEGGERIIMARLGSSPLSTAARL